MASKMKKPLNELPQSGDIWYFAVLQLRAWIDDGVGGKYQPYLVITVSIKNSGIRDFKLLQHISNETIKEALISAMVEPSEVLETEPEIPSTIGFNDKEIINSMLQLLQDAGIKVKFLPTPEILTELVNVIEEELRDGYPEIPGLLSVRKVTPGMVGDLFKAAAQFYQSDPWVMLSSEDILSIQVPPQKEPYFVSLLGQEGTDYALVVYKNLDDVLLVNTDYDDIDEVMPADGYHSLMYEAISGLPFDDIDALERYGWEVADDLAYPVPLVYKNEQDVSRPTRSEILWYQAALLAIPVFVIDHLRTDNDKKLKPAEAEIPVRTTAGSLVVKIKYPAGDIPEFGRQLSHMDRDESEDEKEPPVDQRALEGDIVRMLDSEFYDEIETDLDKAQDLMYTAWDEPNPATRIILAHQALEISPDCADAYVLLAEDQADSLQSAMEYYKMGIEAGERAFGEGFFEQHTGYFWGYVKTRPYMRALYGYAGSLREMGKNEEAVEAFERMLHLNPNDNQGIRYELVDCYLSLDDEVKLDEILDRYEGDSSSVWLYTRTLITFRREGESLEAQKLLKNAIEYNPFVPKYLTGKKRVPYRLPEYIGFGDENEAVAYAAEHLNHWRRTLGAINWMKKNLNL
jgi:tetratricopeptide (TPR) repeat protein